MRDVERKGGRKCRRKIDRCGIEKLKNVWVMKRKEESY
jgi:hypothetical protein